MAVWAVAVPLGLLDGLHWYLQVPPVIWAVVVLHIVTCWTLYPALVPLARFLTRRFPLDVPAWPRHVPIHVLAALAFQYVHFQVNHFLLVWAVRPLFFPARTGSARLYFPSLPPQHLREYPIDLLAYWMIIGFFYASRYYFESHEREMAAAKLETSLAEARLELLRRQLSPHFLFNTLNTISVLALRGDQSAVVDTLGRLSELLRVAIDESNPQTVGLSDELRFLDGYLGIQQIRFADRLQIRLDIAPDSLGASVPFMILQPVVEQGMLRVTVSDSGPGFTASQHRHRRTGIGLANTKSRLQQIYGDTHSIEYGHGLDGGGSVTISIPFRTQDVAG